MMDAKTRYSSNTIIAALFLLLVLVSPISAAIWINEISDKGTSTVCQGNDWIELYNAGDEAVDLSDGYILHDDHGMNDDEGRFVFPAGQLLLPKDYLLLCTQMKKSGDESVSESAAIGFSIDDPLSPQFGISSDDQITLVRVMTQQQEPENGTASFARTSTVYTVISTVTLPNTDDDFDVTYAYNASSGLYVYTSTPTPGAENILTPLLSKEEQLQRHRQAMKKQNSLGIKFFGMDDRGYPVEDAMDEVLELHITMNQENYDAMMANKSFELYQPFQSGKVTTIGGEKVIKSFSSPGKIRPKGQSTLFMAICLGTPTQPFQLDFSATNKSQTLFGAEKIYLRHHMGDNSYLRDYAYNRMLARFGLPHLRTRKVVFYINDEQFGYYNLMEAVDQEYVFARSFPHYDPDSFAVYKMKSMSLDCGAYTEEEMALAATRLDETSTPPYAFQRGSHNPVVPELGMFSVQECLNSFVEEIFTKDRPDTVLAYQRYNENCAEMLLEEGLVDRDLGGKDYDKTMKDFLNNNFRGDVKCDKDCANSDLASKVDIENFLKSFAFYAVLVNADSPLINGNNFYLAQSGDEAFGGPGGWKIVPYDFNAARVVFCHDDVCNQRLVHWSIAQPTCESLEENNLAGPILSDPDLHARYLEYVREFTDTIYANETFIQELVEFQAKQDPFVRQDFWSVFGSFYDKELTPDASNWQEETDRFPLLPTMKARAEDVRAQLDAIDAGTFPRGPHVGVNGDYESWEYCPDWRTEIANTTTCEQGCKYEGCHMEDWTVPSYCEEEFGKCLHGDYDEQCVGVLEGERYPGMEDTVDGRRTFCRMAHGIPVKSAECPAVGALSLTQATSAASKSSSGLSWGLPCVAAIVALVFA